MMNDKKLEILIRNQLIGGLEDLGLDDVEVVAGYQPTIQSEPSRPFIYFFKIDTVPQGWQKRAREATIIPDAFNSTGQQAVISNYQFGARVDLDLADMDQLTAADLVSYTSMIIQSRGTISALAKSGVNMTRASNERNPYFINNKDQHEAAPSFDIGFSYVRSIKRPTGVINEITGSIHPI